MVVIDSGLAAVVEGPLGSGDTREVSHELLHELVERAQLELGTDETCFPWVDDEDFDRRGYKNRRIDTRPPHIRVRQRLLAIAENPMLAWHDEVASIANLFTDNWEDELLRKNFVDLVLQVSLEQPLKTPFLAAVVLVANTNRPEIVDHLLLKLTGCIEAKMSEGDWRDVKLYLKLLACLSGALEGDGVFPLLEELFSKAAELQTASSDDVS